MSQAARPGGAAAASPAIQIDKVQKTFRSSGARDGVVALRDISLSIMPQTFIALLGPSGCGKTTLLRLIDGLIAPDAGDIAVFGKAPAPGPETGFVFQSFRLIPWMSVRSNVEFGLHDIGLSSKEREERVRTHLALVGLSRFENSYPGELSGGMKQRVALARALAPQPRVLLMDEPFASLDAQTREFMQVELMRIWTRSRPVVVFVTHSVDEAIVLADRIVLMGPRPGRVVETLDVDLDRPRWEYDARADERYIRLRSYLSKRMRELVLSDPESEFHGREFGAVSG
jgi:NitT/TauT family transport system ATP-binding protein